MLRDENTGYQEENWKRRMSEGVSGGNGDDSGEDMMIVLEEVRSESRDRDPLEFEHRDERINAKFKCSNSQTPILSHEASINSLGSFP